MPAQPDRAPESSWGKHFGIRNQVRIYLRGLVKVIIFTIQFALAARIMGATDVILEFLRNNTQLIFKSIVIFLILSPLAILIQLNLDSLIDTLLGGPGRGPASTTTHPPRAATSKTDTDDRS